MGQGRWAGGGGQSSRGGADLGQDLAHPCPLSHLVLTHKQPKSLHRPPTSPAQVPPPSDLAPGTHRLSAGPGRRRQPSQAVQAVHSVVPPANIYHTCRGLGPVPGAGTRGTEPTPRPPCGTRIRQEAGPARGSLNAGQDGRRRRAVAKPWARRVIDREEPQERGWQVRTYGAPREVHVAAAQEWGGGWGEGVGCGAGQGGLCRPQGSWKPCSFGTDT